MPTESANAPLAPLAAAETSFQLLAAGMDPLCVHGAELGDGFPDREIPVTELRAMLLHPACDHLRRQRAWTVVVNRARGEGGVWVFAAVGLVMPGLKALRT